MALKPSAVAVAVAVWCWCRCSAGFGVLLVVIGRRAGSRIAGDGIEGLARGRTSDVIAGLHHICQVTPAVASGVPGDRAGANGKVDVASCKYPSAVVSSGGSSRAARRQIGDRGIVPGVCARIIAISFVGGSVAAARVNIAAQR